VNGAEEYFARRLRDEGREIVKRVLLFLLVLLMITSLSSCGPSRFSPVSRRLALQLVAIHSLLGTSGPYGEDAIEVLEEDELGRVMFAFSGSIATGDDGTATRYGILAVLIAQKIPESLTHVYFYDGINFILHQLELGEIRNSASLTEAFVMERFTEEQLEQLKEENDWNMELDEDRLFRVPVSPRRKVRYMTDVSQQTVEEAFSAVSEGFRRSFPLTMDRNGNVIHFVRGANHDRDTQELTFFSSVLLMFDRNGNLIEGTGTMILEDLWDYREELRAFKEANGWAFYYRDVDEDEAVW